MRYLDGGAVAIGGASVALALLTGVSGPVAVGIGVAAFVVAEGGRLAAVIRSSVLEPLEPERPAARLHPEERERVARAEGAVVAIRRGIRLADDGPLRERLDQVALAADGVLEELRRLASHVAVTRQASEQLDLAQLSIDLDRLTAVLESSESPDIVRDLHRSIDAVRGQIRIGRRLDAARVALQARIEAGALGLQQLAAQVSEMTALASPGTSWQHGALIDELAAQLEALREGLNDVASLSERALSIDQGGGAHAPVVP